MNLQQIAAAEQELRGKLNRHVAAKAVAEKEAAMHATEITEALARLAELKTHATAALDACASIAAHPPTEVTASNVEDPSEQLAKYERAAS